MLVFFAMNASFISFQPFLLDWLYDMALSLLQKASPAQTKMKAQYFCQQELDFLKDRIGRYSRV